MEPYVVMVLLPRPPKRPHRLRPEGAETDDRPWPSGPPAMTIGLPAPDEGARGAGGFSRGTNQIGVRLYNERLILSLIRRLGSVPEAEIARLTGLSAQTVSVIMRPLEADGLVLKRDPQRGRVGQPRVPFQLDPEGAFALASRSAGAAPTWCCSILPARCGARSV